VPLPTALPQSLQRIKDTAREDPKIWTSQKEKLRQDQDQASTITRRVYQLSFETSIYARYTGCILSPPGNIE
jgi:hypothetical protein